MFEKDKYAQLVVAAENAIGQAHDEYTGKEPFDKDWQGARRALKHITNVYEENEDILTNYNDNMFHRLQYVNNAIAEETIEMWFKTIGNPEDPMSTNWYWKDRKFWAPLNELKGYVYGHIQDRFEEEVDKHRQYVIIDLSGTGAEFYEDDHEYKGTKLGLKIVKVITGKKEARHYLDYETGNNCIMLEVNGESFEETDPDYLD